MKQQASNSLTQQKISCPCLEGGANLCRFDSGVLLFFQLNSENATSQPRKLNSKVLILFAHTRQIPTIMTLYSYEKPQGNNIPKSKRSEKMDMVKCLTDNV